MEPATLTEAEIARAARATHPAWSGHEHVDGEDWAQGNHTSDEDLERATVHYVPAEDGGPAPVVR